jgi:hypothetical protein
MPIYIVYMYIYGHDVWICCAVQTRVARFSLVQYTNTWKNIPNYHKIYQMAVNYVKWPENGPKVHKIYYFSTERLLNIFRNCDFWSENKPSGNPGWFFFKILETLKTCSFVLTRYASVFLTFDEVFRYFPGTKIVKNCKKLQKIAKNCKKLQFMPHLELQGSMILSKISAIFDNFLRKIWRSSQKPLLWSKFCKM